MKSLVLFELIAVGVLLIALRKSAGASARAERVRLISGLCLALCGLVLGRMWIEVPPASVAAVYDPLHGGIQGYDIGEGWAIIPPWATARYFSVRTQNYTMGGLQQERGHDQEDPIQCQTAEGLSLNIDCTLLYSISPGDANKLWRSVGPNYVGVIVRPNAREAARNVISEYPVMSVYSNAPAGTDGVAGVDFYPGKRQEVADKIRDRLLVALQLKGITLERFLLRNVDYMQPTFEKSIVDKQVAQQRVVTQQYEAQIQQVRAQANVVRAEGDAEGIRLKGNALRVQPRVVEWEFVQKLPENIDVVILPDRVMPLLDLGQQTNAPAPQRQQQPQQQAPPALQPMQMPGAGQPPAEMPQR